MSETPHYFVLVDLALIGCFITMSVFVFLIKYQVITPSKKLILTFRKVIKTSVIF